MSQAGRDQNRVPTLLGLSSTDSTTPIPIFADPSTQRLLVNAILSGTSPVSFPSGSLTDRSGSITTGGTAQTIASSNSSRKYIILENPPTSMENLWFSFTTTATTAAGTGSFALVPGGTYSPTVFIPTGALSVIAATTGHTFSASEA